MTLSDDDLRDLANPRPPGGQHVRPSAIHHHIRETAKELAAELLAARQRIAELEAERQWRPIEEAPKEGTVLLAMPPYDEDSAAWVTEGFWFAGLEETASEPGVPACWMSGHGDVLQPTHWQPLPAPPEDAPDA